jgi:hypothetical protein
VESTRRPLASRSIPRLNTNPNINTNTNTNINININTIPRLLDSTNQPRKERPSSLCLPAPSGSFLDWKTLPLSLAWPN